MATAYLATLAISAALRERELSGHGQKVSTSLLQGVLATTVIPWQRTERPRSENYQSWLIDPRAPKAIYQAADGRWVHQWVILPTFVLGVSQGDRLALPSPESPWQVARPRDMHLRIGMGGENMVILHEFDPQLRPPSPSSHPTSGSTWRPRSASLCRPSARRKRHCSTSCLWPTVRGRGRRPRRGPSPNRTRLRPSACPSDPPSRGPWPAHAGGDRRISVAATGADTGTGAHPPCASAGRRACRRLGTRGGRSLGTQLLADLGADVIKVNTLTDGYWFGSHIAMACNRGKRSISLNLKDPGGHGALERLVRTADVVHHNMRYDAAERLRVDYETLKALKPDLIYCHTRGFEHGPRDNLPGNDQTGAALAGTTFLDGAIESGGRGSWSVCSIGDTGCGLLRHRHGPGPLPPGPHRRRPVHRHLKFFPPICSTHRCPGSRRTDARRRATPPRPHALGWGRLCRLYRTSDGWLCLTVVTSAQWSALCRS